MAVKVRAKRSTRAGRPPAGVGLDGQPEKTSEYPKLTVSVRPATKARLDALVALQKRPAWRIIEDAINTAIMSLSSTDRGLIEALAQRTTDDF
jgi:hypothetical protein